MKTEKEFKDVLFKEGIPLLSMIIEDLNKISKSFIHTDNTYRREEDWKEICLALALLKRKLGNED
jgi:hypothetical protein